jgi:hypothetical protein
MNLMLLIRSQKMWRGDKAGQEWPVKVKKPLSKTSIVDGIIMLVVGIGLACLAVYFLL